MRLPGYVTYLGNDKCVEVLAGNPEAKKPLERPRHRLEDTISVDCQEKVVGMNWIDLAHDRDNFSSVVLASLNFRFPGDVGKFLISRGIISFWRRTLFHRVSPVSQLGS
jgi:hypothetical protein